MLIKKLVIAAVLLGVTGGAWLYGFLTAHGFSAQAKPSWYEAWLARHVRQLATDPSAKRLHNPVVPTPLALAEARDHYADHCALCHANDGSGNTAMGQKMYPPAPDMRQRETQELTDGELFQIIRNGIRFTGMPGWGGDDEENWKLVLWMRHLPQLTPQERELMNEINQLDGDLAPTPAAAQGTRQ